MVWFFVVPFLLLASSAHAATVPAPSEVVMIYDHAVLEEQSNYNFLFTIDGDNTIYPCSANRCSLAPFIAQPTVTMTVYKLPDGFQRVSQLTGQSTLQEYLVLADHRYTLENIPTQPTTTEGVRTYQLAYLQPDNTATTTLSDTITAHPNQVAATQPWWQKWQYILGFSIACVIISGSVWWLWKKRL